MDRQGYGAEPMRISNRNGGGLHNALIAREFQSLKQASPTAVQG